ncbi:MAG: 3-deoxy-manno-octulosonate cytidylyltransferase [Phycisphaerae bacterium]|nr:3-deoxy-manno-octulosonate cytidylyltransferase [Phycisphaerae bacterium]
MSAVVIIPARYASVRLPGKPLLAQTGLPLIVHVVRAVEGAKNIARVVVATDDERIAHAVRDAGSEAVMTRADHTCGTDRLAEAADLLHLRDDDIVVNVQGDEPDMPPSLVEELVSLLETSGCPMATLCTPMRPEEAGDPNKVKVVFSAAGRALYFSRAAVPFQRDPAGPPAEYHLHIGIYAYRVAFLKTFSRLPATPLERVEKLEQLRALENDYPIAVKVVDYTGSGIDTPEDYAAFVNRRKV